MNKKTIFIGIVLLSLLLASCGSSAKDQAVCDAYQEIVDIWPNNEAEFDNFPDDYRDFWDEIQEAGADLESAADSADDALLSSDGSTIGSFVAGYYDRNQSGAIGQGFVPYFNHGTVGGEGLSERCAELGYQIEMP